MFYSIQGEGPTAGIPSIFLRLQGCNLTCGGVNTVQSKALDSGASWRCDTIEVWRKGTPYTSKQLIEYWETHQWLTALKNGAHLVITGGEPLLQEAGIVDLLCYLSDHYHLPPIEIETNATRSPSESLIPFVSYFNVSPKLSNSGMALANRCVPHALAYFSTCSKTVFKVVISCKQDVDEWIETFQLPYSIPASKVMLMPAADSRDSLNKIQNTCVELCKSYGYAFSPRLHIAIWDKKTGV